MLIIGARSLVSIALPSARVPAMINKIFHSIERRAALTEQHLLRTMAVAAVMDAVNKVVNPQAAVTIIVRTIKKDSSARR